MFPMMSYEEFLEKTNKEDCKDSWIDWKTDVCGMTYMEARRTANDPDWGYEQ